jgi:CheY-like chemotaxis protein
MDGFAVLQELLRRPELADAKVVVVSAYEPFDRVEEMGRINPQIVACVRKPVSIDGLGKILQEAVRGLNPKVRRAPPVAADDGGEDE